MTVVEAIVQNGQIVLKEPLGLPDGTPVRVRVETPAASPLLAIADTAVDMGVTDGAERHDHHIYGTPEQSE